MVKIESENNIHAKSTNTTIKKADDQKRASDRQVE